MSWSRTSPTTSTSSLQAAEKGPSASLAPSAAGSTYREYASPAAFGRRLASGPFSTACLADGAVEGGASRLEEAVHGEGLLEEDARHGRLALSHHGIVRVAGHVHHAQIG